MRAKEAILCGPSYNDGSIDDLVRLRRIESIELRQTSITDAGIERIRRELPECEVIRR
jgi:hypothetical protein